MNVDLNLLKLFSILYQTQSVSATADSLNLSQSACSHALNRLRSTVNDELFVRVGNSMIPTPFADRLEQQISPALQQLESGLARCRTFSIEHPHTYTIAVTDYTLWCLRPFVAHLSQHYPTIGLDFVQLEERAPLEAMQQGKLDFVCGFEHQTITQSYGLAHHCWLQDRYVTLQCAESNPPSTTLTLQQFLRYKHIVVTPWNEQRGIVDVSLARLKKQRKVAIKTASVLAAPYLLPGTSYVLTIPERYAINVKRRLALAIYEVPLDVPDYRLLLSWHKTQGKTDKISWFINAFSDFMTTGR